MSIDKVLAALDAGLQSSEERGYPERVDDASLCARCIIHEPAPTADICAPCRAFLLGDSDVDPSEPLRLSDVRTEALAADLAQSRYATEADLERALARYGGPTYQPPDRERRVNRPGYLHATSPVRVQRLDRDGLPTGEPADLSGYMVHHVNGDPHDNRPENLQIVPARENVAHVHEYDDTLQCRCGVMDIGVVPPNRWTIDYTYVGEGRRVVHYSADGRHGQYVTDDERPFEVRMYSRDGLSLRAELVNADDIVCHWVTDTGDEWVRNGLGGWGTENAPVLRREYYVDGHGDVHTPPRSGRDWQAEAYAWLRQIVSDARQRLGL